MAWFTLCLAGLLEAFGVAMINQLQISRTWKTVGLLIMGFGASLALLGYSLRFLPMGTAYAVWTGIGVVGGTLIGMIRYNESKDWRRVVFITMILGSVIGLKLIS
ncbi:small multidrug resistance protein [Desulfitobacterium hafniense DCB-2]|uniref:Small multidrug resistance protein n=1 Tax=Desulfitobacterium hafniense (strain DSM 10664 / DCB-2) TaxID=272564 RepID=B8FZR0_DESHD|nr:multidrug efflux SMR transporter [Desulfitobacterium hafniense]ACL19134.1 small multidrug resistance protein [Desulfitobacterium hafniense DCB-2]